jgi:hypothetical protein
MVVMVPACVRRMAGGTGGRPAASSAEIEELHREVRELREEVRRLRDQSEGADGDRSHRGPGRGPPVPTAALQARTVNRKRPVDRTLTTLEIEGPTWVKSFLLAASSCVRKRPHCQTGSTDRKPLHRGVVQNEAQAGPIRNPNAAS